jgi:hypothetical protein
MVKKNRKEKKPLPPPMGNRQIAISQIRKLTELVPPPLGMLDYGRVAGNPHNPGGGGA